MNTAKKLAFILLIIRGLQLFSGPYLIIVSICTSCSYDDYMLTDNYLMDNTFQSYIGLTDIKNGPKTKLEIEMFNEAAERFSSRIIIEKDNTVKLIEHVCPVKMP